MSEPGPDKPKPRTEGDQPEQLVILGHVSGVHGLQGWLKVYSHTDPRENIASYSRLLLDKGNGWESWKVSSGRRQGKNVVIKLKGCNTRDDSEALVGAKIAIKRDQLPELEFEGEYYWTDLVGLTVTTTDGVELGQIDHLFETGANDVIVVKGDRERLIPYLWEQVVVEVDLDAGTMLVDWDPEF